MAIEIIRRYDDYEDVCLGAVKTSFDDLDEANVVIKAFFETYTDDPDNDVHEFIDWICEQDSRFGTDFPNPVCILD